MRKSPTPQPSTRRVVSSKMELLARTRAQMQRPKRFSTWRRTAERGDILILDGKEKPCLAGMIFLGPPLIPSLALPADSSYIELPCLALRPGLVVCSGWASESRMGLHSIDRGAFLSSFSQRCACWLAFGFLARLPLRALRRSRAKIQRASLQCSSDLSRFTSTKSVCGKCRPVSRKLRGRHRPSMV